VDAFDPLLKVAGIDLLITQSGDLAVTPDGDTLLAYGLNNIIQTAQLALNTKKGALLHYPGYGFGVPVGESTADVSPTQLHRQLEEVFSSDPTFTGVYNTVVTKSGPVLKISFSLGLKGVEQLIPISFDVRR
jgi:hypothetical protein